MSHRTGFRISELLSLGVGDVYQHARVLDQITVECKFMKGSKSRTRASDGSPRAIGRMQAWRLPQAAYDAHWLVDQLGTHTLRKTFANRMYERLNHDLVGDPSGVGHASMTSTVVYLRFRQEDIDAANIAA